MRTPRKARRRRGFTIVEIMVVVVIIGVLASMILPKVFFRIGQAKHNTARQQLNVLEQAIELFSTDYERLPEQLTDLVECPPDIPEDKWVPPTIKRKNLLDPWDRIYEYRCPGEHGVYDLFSLGRDGQLGGEKEDEDIVNW